jgi:hypothetical protein
VPARLWPYLVGGLAVFLGALASWLWMRSRGRVERPAVPARPPLEEALAALDALERSSHVAEQRFRQFFYTLTDIVRVYFERECEIGAPEMTSEELLLALQERHFPPPLCEQMQRWIGACDLVKYASQRPRSEHCQTALTLARAIVTSAHHHHAGVGQAFQPVEAEAA